MSYPLAKKFNTFSLLIFITSSLTFSLVSRADISTITSKIIYFSVDAQPVDQALIKLAQQADQSILFSYDLTNALNSKAIDGYYSVSLALRKLLKNTHLIAQINAKGQWSIKQKVKVEGYKDTKPIIKAKKKIKSIERIAIVGSHINGRTVKDLPVPVDIISGDTLRNSGHTNLGQMLQALVPSFNFSRSAISDGSDVLQPATLRGLGPDQTLILLNGKRRHQASLIHINSSVGRGTAGTDMNAIAVRAIKRIEILRDGAAAQYGSDAIAGVINIVLNDSSDQSTLETSVGAYKQGDGEDFTLSYTQGLALSHDGFVNATLSLVEHQSTNRSGLHGACQFDQCVQVENGHWQTSDPRELSASRETFRIGDPSYQQLSFAANSELELNKGQLYGFLTYSHRENESAAFFRHNANTHENPILGDSSAAIPQGYLPKINSDIEDISYSLGYKVSFDNDATIDISYTYGKNQIDYTTSDSLNASYANYLLYTSDLTTDELRTQLPCSAFAYGLSLSLETVNLLFKKDYENYSLVLGAEFRQDKYEIIPGEAYSFEDYDTKNHQPLFEHDAAGGIQGFPGVSPELGVNESRNVVSLFAESVTQINDFLQLSAAVRYDDYDVFGNSSNSKIAAHWQVNDNIILRGAYSTGFRAPSMQQMYFNNISTQFIVDESGSLLSEEVETFRNDSTLTTRLGVPTLKEEESDNLSIGLIYSPTDNIDLSVDFYQINIDDRIVISSKLGMGISHLLDQAFIEEGVTKGQFFLNGAGTKTQGTDIVASWQTQALAGNINFTLAANFTNTEVTKLFTPSHSTLHTIAVEKIFSEQDISIIEEWQPRSKVSLNTRYKNPYWTVNLLLNHYGKYTITDGGKQTYSEELLTDVSINYQVSKKLSVTLGSHNLFNVMPDVNSIGNSRGGTIENEQGDIIVESTGVFKYSRRSAPFGFNGAYYYMNLHYAF
ncbi:MULTISPECIES: TonB-dependent receptor plug domain-containing protein [unclassified Colwellia]|uniref:TonB-dependent receptor plug domain-containing protein n=1 Tax=unclassified Colwellia TaxID=196834 RepID=UPI0015F3F421|nr:MULTISPECIES: TonB-dependent receptor [unclassified Colwellia]MBA6255597.1 TonB-dependent receptor [Colwellia sp. MB3u-28]MBA6261738.1 TonB-dependent receptor [Colwellia sp. MB3u-41]